MKQTAGLMLSTAFAGGVLFGLSGTLQWWNGWAFLLVILALGLMSSVAIGHTPGLAKERRTAAAGAEAWDRWVVRLTSLAMPVMLVLAALDHRAQWLPRVPRTGSVVAFLILVPATVLTYRAIAVNRFFSSHVRIQADRGHTVVSTGPYRFLRHPGYAGSVIFNLLAPLAVGSWVAMVPGFLAAGLLVWRTSREDHFLANELPGYADYASRVHYRLIPGVW
jgi:protein-S-isoprenylcysteine O-methyltransferase Ste14